MVAYSALLVRLFSVVDLSLFFFVQLRQVLDRDLQDTPIQILTKRIPNFLLVLSKRIKNKDNTF